MFKKSGDWYERHDTWVGGTWPQIPSRLSPPIWVCVREKLTAAEKVIFSEYSADIVQNRERNEANGERQVDSCPRDQKDTSNCVSRGEGQSEGTV